MTYQRSQLANELFNLALDLSGAFAPKTAPREDRSSCTPCDQCRRSIDVGEDYLIVGPSLFCEDCGNRHPARGRRNS